MNRRLTQAIQVYLKRPVGLDHSEIVSLLNALPFLQLTNICLNTAHSNTDISVLSGQYTSHRTTAEC